MLSRVARNYCLTGLILAVASGMAGCGRDASANNPGNANGSSNSGQPPETGVVKVVKKPIERDLKVSSELVPFQQIDVYAKEAGFVEKLNVDYGSHVKKGDVMAVLEIPEFQETINEDKAEIEDATSQVSRMKEEVERVEAQEKVSALQYQRLSEVSKNRPGLVAQQEVDDRQGADLAALAQVAGAKAALQSAQSQLQRAQAKLRHDQTLYDYSKITAEFNGVVTKRYANQGTVMQSGVNSSTQALPLVQLSEDDLFRLVIPVPESYVPYVRIGDPVEVRVPALNRTFPGKVTRFSVDVEADTRTMHTEVNVPNPTGVLVPGEYAEATLKIDQKAQAITVPPEAINIEGDKRSVWVVDDSGKVHKQPLTLGVETPNDVEVLQGVKPGEMVVVGDRSSLKDGEVVRPKVIQLVRGQSDDADD